MTMGHEFAVFRKSELFVGLVVRHGEASAAVDGIVSKLAIRSHSFWLYDQRHAVKDLRCIQLFISYTIVIGKNP